MPKLLFTLAVVGMESAEEGLSVTLNESVPLLDKLIGKLEELGPGVAGLIGAPCGNVQGRAVGAASGSVWRSWWGRWLGEG